MSNEISSCFICTRWEKPATPTSPCKSSPAQFTSQLNEPSNYKSVLNDVTLAIMTHQVYDPNNNLLPVSPSQEAAEFSDLISYLKSGQPVLLLLGTSQPGGHAVVAYGVISLGNGNCQIVISDPNHPQTTLYASYDSTSASFVFNDGDPFNWTFFSIADPTFASEQCETRHFCLIAFRSAIGCRSVSLITTS